MEERIRPEDYAHSPAHHAVALGDNSRLARLIASLPRLAHPSEIVTEADAVLQDRLAERVSAVLDRRDVPRRDTPLHLAVRLDLPAATRALAAAGADPSLQNSPGWTPLQEALCLRRGVRLAAPLLRAHRLSAWRKLRRRLPPLLRALRALPDLHLELGIRLDAPLLPRALAPSDALRLWKRGADLRADTSLAGLDGFRPRRHPLSFLFLASVTALSAIPSAPPSLPFGSLLVLDHAHKQVRDAFDGADSAELDKETLADATAYRPGLDVTAAELVGRTNWRRKEKTEMVGEWKARVYELHNVVFSFKTLKAVQEEEAAGGGQEEELLPLEFNEESDDGFLVAELPELPPRHSCYEPGRFGHAGGRDRDIGGKRRSVDVPHEEYKRWEKLGKVVGKSKEKEMVKSLRPTVWLTEDFPLKIEEFLPLLDILASKVKAVRRLRELLTTKLPPGTFPVKVAIPIVPTVRVVFTFTKFAYLQPIEEFFTPPSSPRLLSVPEEEEQRNAENVTHKSSWLKWNNNLTSKTSAARSRTISSSQVVDHVDPFSMPSDYVWVSISTKSQSLKKVKSRRGMWIERRS